MAIIDRSRRRLGPPPSMPNSKREPVDEIVTVQKPLAGQPVIRTLAPQKTSLKPEPVALPDKARAEKGLTLMQLLKRQPRYLINSAEDIVVRSYKKAKTKGGMPAIIGTARDMNTRPMRIHQFKVIGLDKGKPDISTQRRIKVSCDCEWFCFVSEYALWTWGAASIKFSNGQPAKVRNPGNHPILCKHLTQVLMTIKKRND